MKIIIVQNYIQRTLLILPQWVSPYLIVLFRLRLAKYHVPIGF